MKLDASTASCTIFTFREGLLSAVGHDLTLAVTRFTIDVGDDTIDARFAADSLRVRGDVSSRDRASIEGHASDDVLAARQFPEVRFVSRSITRDGNSARITGELGLHGRARVIEFVARDDGRDWIAEVTLDQRDFGIKPFTAMLGALRVRADVRVRVTLPSH